MGPHARGPRALLRGGATATHYEVLGIGPAAGQEEIRRAYTELARRHHPDQHVDESPAARARAETQMRTVNAAWQVLRNPVRRAAYDAELRGQRPVWQQGPPSAPRTSTVRPGQPSTGGPGPGAPPRAGGEVTTSSFPGWLVAALGALVVVALVVAVAVANYQQNVAPGTDPPTRSTLTDSFTVGDCVVITSVSASLVPEVADCGSAGAQRVISLRAVGNPCPADTRSFDVQDQRVRLCLEP